MKVRASILCWLAFALMAWAGSTWAEPVELDELPEGATLCASEGGTCNVVAGFVCYGRVSDGLLCDTFSQPTAVPCSVEYWGDPAPGKAKVCWRGTGSLPGTGEPGGEDPGEQISVEDAMQANWLVLLAWLGAWAVRRLVGGLLVDR